MPQITKQFDPKTVRKLKKSAEIAVAGFMAAAIPILSKEMYDYVTSGFENPINWYIPLGAGLAAVLAWVYNSVQEWLAGAAPGQFPPTEPPQS